MTDERPGGFTGTEVYLLHEIVIHFDRRARAELDAHGLTYTEFLVMMAVRERPGASQSVVAQTFNFSASAVSQKVSSLLRKGLLTQHRDETNRRIVRLRLTEPGDMLLNQVYRELSSRSSAVFDTLGQRRAEFRTALTDLLAILRHDTAAGPPIEPMSRL